MTTTVNKIAKVIGDIIGYILMVTAIAVLVPFVVITLTVCITIVLPIMAIVYAIKDDVLSMSLCIYVEMLCEVIGALVDCGKYLINWIKR